ncbi:MAG TPA: universal stress protein [Noviherbaspirillum sp.]|nr:universal stress protein [Noviherbaspirillum sp.]
MAYKTILLHVDDSRNASARIALATQLALREEAHLIGAAWIGSSPYVVESMMAGMDTPLIAGYLDELRQRAQEQLKRFEQAARDAGLASFSTRPVMNEPAGGLSAAARYADLCILSQYDRDNASPSDSPDLPEHVVMRSGAPVLVVPAGWAASPFGQHLLVAWNDSAEAWRAIHFALPLMKRAQAVDLVTLYKGELPAAPEERPGVRMAALLERHGIKTELIEKPAEGETGTALVALARQRGVDGIVMGCYGHSRVREVVLGGVTRRLLQDMHVPVLMAH